MKTALIIGVTGQDGSYLAELLLAKGYRVHGATRDRGGALTNIRHLLAGADNDGPSVALHEMDLADDASIRRVLSLTGADEIYNLGGQSRVGLSFDQPVATADVVATGTTRILEALRDLQLPARFYQASSSEMFGNAARVPTDETTPFHPRSPYGCAKVHAFFQSINYRESYGMFVSNGILFNHESPRRAEHFVTRKITAGAARIKLGLAEELVMGNIDVARDWGFAGDYVEAMWRMLQHDEPEDFVVATGQCHTVRDFLAAAFARVGLDYRQYVRVDRSLYRPADIEKVQGDPSKARRLLGWRPAVGFESLVGMMVDADLAGLRRQRMSA